tara:strand:+ start:112 stop:363 length:252 start_codon:yes stop_codon:yes gene_type:complete
MKTELSNIEEVDKVIEEILEKKMDYKKIDNIEIDGINTKDYPDFCDAYIVSADYDGVPMTDEQLDEINDDGQFQYECIMNDLQ